MGEGMIDAEATNVDDGLWAFFLFFFLSFLGRRIVWVGRLQWGLFWRSGE